MQEKTKRTLKGVFTMVVACQFFKTVLKVVRDPNWVDPSLTKKKKRCVFLFVWVVVAYCSSCVFVGQRGSARAFV